MSREQDRIGPMIAVTAAVALLLAASTGLSLRWQELGTVGVLLGSMGACAACFHRRRNQRFAMISIAGAAVAVVAVGMCKPWAVWRVGKAVADRPRYARRPRSAEVASEQGLAAPNLLLRE